MPKRWATMGRCSTKVMYSLKIISSLTEQKYSTAAVHVSCMTDTVKTKKCKKLTSENTVYLDEVAHKQNNQCSRYEGVTRIN